MAPDRENSSRDFIARIKCLVARAGTGCGSGTVMGPLNLRC
jgi:hypothetical protein